MRRSGSRTKTAALAAAILVFGATSSTARLNYIVTHTADDGSVGSLRWAITQSNTHFGNDDITFNIAGAGVHTINLQSALPVITQPVILDATTQPGWTVEAPKISISGSKSSFQDCLAIDASDPDILAMAVYGLSLVRCGYGIRVLDGGDGADIGYNFIGTEANGLTVPMKLAYPSLVSVPDRQDAGIVIDPDAWGVVIYQNLLSGNDVAIEVRAQGAWIQGNRIGTDVTGTIGLGNGDGISIGEPGVTATVVDNVIASSDRYGIADAAGAAWTVRGNFIGTDATATRVLGNGAGGIRPRAGNWTIGGCSPGQANVIAHNGWSSTLPAGGTLAINGTMVRCNRIFDNRPLGIDLTTLNPDGFTPNDDQDFDGKQNFPLITAVTPGPAQTQIAGILRCSPNSPVAVDLFFTPACTRRPQAYLQGETLVGTITVTTDVNGNGSFSTTVPFPLAAGRTVTATASLGGTSEFSQGILFSVTPSTGFAGGAPATLRGAFFAAGATVTVGGMAAQNVNVVDSSTITATMPQRPPGSLSDVTVVNVDGTRGTLRNGWLARFVDEGGLNVVAQLMVSGISNGVGGGRFGPNDPVTREQMALLLLRAKHGVCYTPPACSGDFPVDAPCGTPYADWIEAAVDQGIARACGVNRFCPKGTINRAVMAGHLLRAKHGVNFAPEPCQGGGPYADVPCASQNSDWIGQLRLEGVLGFQVCGPALLNFCPQLTISRDVFAGWIVRAFP